MARRSSSGTSCSSRKGAGLTLVSAQAIRRSLRMRRPDSTCSACRMPMRRVAVRQPGKQGSTPSTMASRASPSSARVPGMKPKSCGKQRPAGSLRLMQNAPSSASYLYLLRLPAGVSISTWTRPEPGSRKGSAEGVGDFTVPQCPARHHPSLHARTAVVSRVLRECERRRERTRLSMVPRQSLRAGIVWRLCDGRVAAILRPKSGGAL
jgi:hypothetical protein